MPCIHSLFTSNPFRGEVEAKSKPWYETADRGDLLYWLLLTYVILIALLKHPLFNTVCVLIVGKSTYRPWEAASTQAKLNVMGSCKDKSPSPTMCPF